MPVVSMNSENNGTTPFAEISGVILAGGKSSRYGSNKALVEFHGIPLIKRVVGVMQSLFKYIILITNNPDEYEFLRLPMRKDLIEGLGPIGGVFTGLTAIPSEAGVFVACDMPYLNRGLIRYIVETRGSADIVVPRVDDKMEPLTALYSKVCLQPVKSLIQSQKYKLSELFDRVSVRYIEESEIRHFDPELKSFLNLNQPRELREFMER